MCGGMMGQRPLRRHSPDEDDNSEKREIKAEYISPKERGFPL
jgi:hypothetical protein